jgi:hypothetical protein
VNKPLDSGPAPLSCYPLGGLDVDGMKSLQPVFDVKADCIYNAVGAGQCIRDRLLVLKVGLQELKLRIIRTKLFGSLVRMP